MTAEENATIKTDAPGGHGLAPSPVRCIRIIRNRWGTATNAMLRWKSQFDGDKPNHGILWGEPIQKGPDHWHVYGAHRGRWIPLNVEFLPDKIVLVYPQGVRKRKYNSTSAITDGYPWRD
jgi:hypothetical protein